MSTKGEPAVKQLNWRIFDPSANKKKNQKKKNQGAGEILHNQGSKVQSTSLFPKDVAAVTPLWFPILMFIS